MTWAGPGARRGRPKIWVLLAVMFGAMALCLFILFRQPEDRQDHRGRGEPEEP